MEFPESFGDFYYPDMSGKGKIMKKISIILLVAVMLLGSSCTTIENVKGTNSDGSPVWTKEIPYSNKFFYGVGSARFQVDRNSQKAADADAKANLAANIETTIDAFTEVSYEENGGMLTSFENMIRETQSITLRYIKIEERWVAPDGTYWTLCSLPAKDVAMNLELDANEYRNKLEREMLMIEREKLDILKSLEEMEPFLVSAAEKLENGEELDFAESKSLDDLQKILDSVEYNGRKSLEETVDEKYSSIAEAVKRNRDSIHSEDLKNRMLKVLEAKGYDVE